MLLDLVLGGNLGRGDGGAELGGVAEKHGGVSLRCAYYLYKNTTRKTAFWLQVRWREEGRWWGWAVFCPGDLGG